MDVELFPVRPSFLFLPNIFCGLLFNRIDAFFSLEERFLNVAEPSERGLPTPF